MTRSWNSTLCRATFAALLCLACAARYGSMCFFFFFLVALFICCGAVVEKRQEEHFVNDCDREAAGRAERSVVTLSSSVPLHRAVCLHSQLKMFVYAAISVLGGMAAWGAKDLLRCLSRSVNSMKLPSRLTFEILARRYLRLRGPRKSSNQHAPRFRSLGHILISRLAHSRTSIAPNTFTLARPQLLFADSLKIYYHQSAIMASPANLPPIFNPTSQDIEMLLAAQCHLGSKNLQVHMETYLWKTRPDGINVINLSKTWYAYTMLSQNL